VSRWRTHRIIVGTLLALLAGCGGPERAPAAGRAPAAVPDSVASPAARDSTPTVVFLGTSLTAGYGLDPDSAWTAIIQRKLDSAGLRYQVVNAGVSGESSAGALDRIDWILRRRPTVLMIETGANDGLRGQDPDSIEAHIQAIIDSVRSLAPDARLLLAGMEALPNLGPQYTRRFHAIYPALAERNHIPLIPFLLAGVAGIDSLNQQDGIHPNDAGSHLVADNVWPALLRLLPGAREAR
jgi:acyl-CoA thioesterase I